MVPKLERTGVWPLGQAGMVEEMCREWQIREGSPRNFKMKNPTKKSRQCCLLNKATNKTTKGARIATIVGRRIINGTIAPFCDEETRGKEVTMTRRIGHSTDTVTTTKRKAREGLLDQTSTPEEKPAGRVC